MKKKTWIIAIISIFVVAGGASAFFLLDKTPKEQYFYSEIKTIQHIQELVETRYEDESEWASIGRTKATDSTYELSGEYEGNTDPQIEHMLNNSNISLRIAADPNEREVETEINATVLGVDVDPIKAYITTEEVIVGLPFYDQLIQLKDKDFGKFMTTLDPSYEGSETLGLDSFLGDKGLYTEENLEYLKDEYAMYIYESIPEDAFTVTDETVDVNGKSIKAEKVAMTLTEAEVQKILKDVLQKAKEDPKFEEIAKESTESFIDQLNLASSTVEPVDYGEMMDELIKSVDDINLPSGINSTIWHDSNLIVKRDFNVETPDAGIFAIAGTQSLEETAQNWEYSVGVDNETLNITGNLSATKDGIYTDEVSILDTNNVGLVYNAEEKLAGEERTFERTFMMENENQPMEFLWNGKSNFKKDTMQADHEFVITIDESSNAVIKIGQESKIIKKVNLPADSEKMVNIGTMDSDSLQQLLTEDIYPEMQSWGMNIMQQFEQ
ncbi:DUF6583 family protein [Psychrobacillus antarcticus]|uniref:DUF6583 family protein n=1 Tax=Psychrobacillus antarcticus TaxID=2879115 RepID=UPI0024088F62|nr:DUF6583 family protein [Psychrobacillus antarcticus]